MLQRIVSLMILAFHSCLQTGHSMYVGNTPIYRPGKQVSRQYENHRYHPTTYSKESSEETDMKDKPTDQQPPAYPFIQYAYPGGQGPHQSTPGDLPDLQDDLKIHQGEVLNHVLTNPGMKQQSIIPRPHPVYQQMTKKPNSQSTASSSSQSETIPFSISGPPLSLHPGTGFPSVEGTAGYGEQNHHHHHHHEVEDGYHYFPVIHRPPPPPRPPQPPDKSKGTISESDYAYYYIGRHLWYVPLYFSIYFIAYVGLLVLKSIARHKVLYPYKAEQAGQNGGRQLEAMNMFESAQQKYLM